MTVSSDQTPAASTNGKSRIGKWVLWALGGLGAFAAMGVPMISPGYEHGWSSSERIRLLHDFAITRPGVEVTSLGDLQRKRVLGYVGALWYLGDAFRSAMKDNPQYREIDNHRAQVRLLLQGRVDVIVADRLLISWYVDYLRGEGKTETEVVYHDLFEPVEHEFICRSPEIAAEFSAGLAQILADGTLEAILAKYGKEDADTMLLPLNIDAIPEGVSQ